MSTLLNDVRAAIRHRHYRTETTYVRWVERYVQYHARQLGHYVHPRNLREPHAEAFLNHLAAERNVAASTTRACGQGTQWMGLAQPDPTVPSLVGALTR